MSDHFVEVVETSDFVKSSKTVSLRTDIEDAKASKRIIICILFVSVVNLNEVIITMMTKENSDTSQRLGYRGH